MIANNIIFSEKDYVDNLNTFLKLYKSRPITNNTGGMLFQHMFFVYTVLKKIKPEYVIESGVFKGQSTWLIKSTLPNSKVVSLDIDLGQREYINKDVDYYEQDFSKLSFKNTSNTLLFLDDHVNHYERIKEAYFYGIKNIVLEDNYRVHDSKVDFYTLDHIFKEEEFIHKPNFLSLLKTLFMFSKIIKKKMFSSNYNCEFDILKIKNRIRDVNKKNKNLKNIQQIIDYYFIFPNIKNMLYKKSGLDEFKNEIEKYNFLTYIKLK